MLIESSVLSSSSFSFFQSSSSSSIGDDSVHQSVLNQEKESKEMLETKLYAPILQVMVLIQSFNSKVLPNFFINFMFIFSFWIRNFLNHLVSSKPKPKVKKGIKKFFLDGLDLLLEPGSP
jgi:hypothetical protein